MMDGLTQKNGRQCQMNKSVPTSRSGERFEQNVVLPGHNQHDKPTLPHPLLMITRHQTVPLHQLILPIHLRINSNLHCNEQPGRTCNRCCPLMQHRVQPIRHNSSSMGSGIRHALPTARSIMPAITMKHILAPLLMVVVMEE